MITLTELKEYINFPSNDKDVFLQSCINEAVSNIEEKCKRTFVYGVYTEFLSYALRYCNSHARDSFFLNHLPIVSIDNIYELSDNVYEDIFVSPDTVTSSTSINAGTGEVSLLGYSFPYGSKNGKVVYTAGYQFKQLTGSVSNDLNGNVVTGDGTTFLADFVVGDFIEIGSETKKVVTITSDTSLVVDFNFNAVNVDAVYYINNIPAGLKKFCKQLATWIYYQSPQSGLNYLGKNSVNQGGQSNTGISLQEPNWQDIIDYYRIINI